MLIVLSMMAMVILAITPHFRSGRQTWDIVGDRHADVLQNSRIGMDKMTRELRQALSFSASGGDYVEFVDREDNNARFQYSAGYLQYGPPDSLNVLAGPIDNLSFIYYKEDGVTQAATPEEIRSVLIQLTASDSEGIVEPITLSSRVFVRKDPIAESATIVINEIMYNPSGNPDSQWEWIELYNRSAVAVDVSGWRFNNKNIGGLGSVVISAGGYATIAKWNSPVFWLFQILLPPSVAKLLVNGNMNMNNSADTITIWDDLNQSVDSVTYDDNWGGDGNNKTLERIDPLGDSNDENNWEESALFGTPGSAN